MTQTTTAARRHKHEFALVPPTYGVGGGLDYSYLSRCECGAEKTGLMVYSERTRRYRPTQTEIRSAKRIREDAEREKADAKAHDDFMMQRYGTLSFACSHVECTDNVVDGWHSCRQEEALYA